MKLYYYQDELGRRNFGDDLNPWLFNRLLQNILDDDDSKLFIGIGTILNDRIPDVKEKVVFGSGVGYGCDIPRINDSWKIYCVRGPLSARKLNIDPNLAIIDSAVLLNKFYKNNSSKKKYNVSFMPHITAAYTGGSTWRTLCNELGYGYIDPRDDIDRVIADIDGSHILITESMHGAIVAETLRVPWIQVVTNSDILEFKWQDWCSSIGVNYNPVKLFPLWDSDCTHLIGNIKKDIKKRILSAKLKNIAQSHNPILSKDYIFDALCNRLYEKLDQFISDYKKQ